MTRQDVRNLAILFLVATALFADVLFFGSNFFHRDLFRYHYPMKHVVREVIAHGEFPFWNRYFSAGQPMAANPAYEVFYPVQWLTFVGDDRFGFAFHIVAHVYIALLGMYLLLRALGTRGSVALFGAASFGFSGFLLGSMTTLPTFFVWSWAPMTGWAVTRLLSGAPVSPPALGAAEDSGAPPRTLQRLAVAAIIAGVQMLIGEPIALLQVWGLIGCAALLTANRRRALVMVAGLLIATIAIAAVQIVPAIDHARDSVRSRGFTYDLVTDFSMPLFRPLELVVPRLFGVLDIRKHEIWGAAAFSRRTPYLISIYVGVAMAILAIAGMIAGVRGRGAVMAICAVSYLLAIGGKTPLYRVLYDAGIARSLRYPEKFAASALFALVVFAAIVAERFLDGDPRVRKAVRWSGIGGLVICAAVFIVWRDVPPTAHRVWLIGLAITAAWTALAFSSASSRAWNLVAFMLLLCDVAWLGREASPTLPRDFFTPPVVAKQLDADRDDYAIFNRGDWRPSDPNRQSFHSVPGWWTARNSLQPMTPAAWGIRSVLELDYDETALLPTHDLLDLMMRLGNSGYARWADPFMLRSNGRYVLDFRPMDQDIAEARGEIAMSRPVNVTRVPEPGRYFFASDLVTARSPDEILRTFVHTPAAVVPFPAFRPAAARVIAVSETSNTATIDIESSGRAFLVAAVTRHKYWHATIDGRVASLLPANVAYQGLVVPAGRHRIRMTYRNPLVVWSGIVSALSLMAAIVLTRPRRRPQSES